MTLLTHAGAPNKTMEVWNKFKNHGADEFPCSSLCRLICCFKNSVNRKCVDPCREQRKLETLSRGKRSSKLKKKEKKDISDNVFRRWTKNWFLRVLLFFTTQTPTSPSLLERSLLLLPFPPCFLPSLGSYNHLRLLPPFLSPTPLSASFLCSLPSLLSSLSFLLSSPTHSLTPA